MRQKNWVPRFLHDSRVGHLATSNKGIPHVIPVCYIFNRNTIYSSIDEKPKTVQPMELRRIQNILKNPKAALVVDQYSENWRRLRYVLVQGDAQIITRGLEHMRAISLLHKKYPQYRSMRLDQRPIIKIKSNRLTTWRASQTRRLKGRA